MFNRYEITTGDAHEWDDAEKQVAKATRGGGKSTTVSVKAKNGGAASKRKAGEAVEEALKEAESLKEGGKKGGKKSKHR